MFCWFFFLFWLVCTMFCHDVCLDRSHFWTYDNMTALPQQPARQDAARRRQVARSLLQRSKPLVDATTKSGEVQPFISPPQVMKVQVDLCCWCPLTGRCWWVMLTFDICKKYPSYLILGWRNQGNGPWYFQGKREVHHGLICHWGSLEPLAGWLDAHQRIDWYGTPSFGHSGFDLPKGLGCLDGRYWKMMDAGSRSHFGRLSFGTWGM